jgi:hypothetical protein
MELFSFHVPRHHAEALARSKQDPHHGVGMCPRFDAVGKEVCTSSKIQQVWLVLVWHQAS